MALYVLDGLFNSLAKKLYWIETMAMLANLAMKLTVTVGVFVIDTQMPAMMTVTAWAQIQSCVPCCQCHNSTAHFTDSLSYFSKRW